MHSMKFTIFAICTICLHLSNVEYINFVGQPISRSFHLEKPETLYPLKNNNNNNISPFLPSLQILATTLLLFLSMNLATPDASYMGHLTVFVSFCLAISLSLILSDSSLWQCIRVFFLFKQNSRMIFKKYYLAVPGLRCSL